MFNLFKIFGPEHRLRKIVAEINALEPEISKLGDDFLLNESQKLQSRAKAGEDLNSLLPRAFALVRETANRKLNQRHYDVQLMGGIVLAEGKIAEMRTGEGKTLAATAPAYLHALKGDGSHVVTVNDYLAKRDAVWMGQIYHALGLTVACLVHEGALMYDPDHKITNENHGESALLDKERDSTGAFLVQQEYLRPIPRRAAYVADITYGTNHEFGFDYLRDNLAYDLSQQVQRPPYFAIIDEVDSILIDEARTPLIISAPDTESSDYYKTFSRVVSRLEKGADYLVEEKHHSTDITESGINKVEKALNIKDLYGPENSKLTHYLQESLKAYGLYQKDKDYVVKDGEIIIVDQFTGRMMFGRRYSGGLHQAIEAKENVQVQKESRTYAQISIQNYFRLYKKLAGMTGTASTSAEEFDKVYKLDVVSISPNKINVRKDGSDLIFKTGDAKYNAIIEDIRARQKKGQPVLIGTVSIEKNELMSQLLSRGGVNHEILNAKNHEREGAIIAQAGRFGAVTVATNMAGRGVDIILGGNPLNPEEAIKVKEAGGLYVIGTERHEARRIDNQLRGRSARQGDPGESQFYLSLEDDLMRIFGGDRLKNLMQTLNMPEDMPISSGIVSRALTEAQKKVEGLNFDARKHLLEYDDVLNRQRLSIYKKRQEILESKTVNVKSTTEHKEDEFVAPIPLSHSTLSLTLNMLDMLWMNHLSDMEALSDAVRLRAYGQHDPLAEYKHEGHKMFQEMLATFDEWVTANGDKLKGASATEGQSSHSVTLTPVPHTLDPNVKVGRNDPCSCGSGKKYKKCHGK